MSRVEDPSTRLLGFDLMSEIDTYPFELGDHCLDLVLSPAVLVHFKFFISTQTFSLIRFHGRLLKLSRFGALALSIGNNGKVGPTHTESTRISNPRPRWRPWRSARSITSASRNIQS